MIFVSVSEDDRRQIVAVFFEKVEIGNRNIYAEWRFFGKSHTGVDNDHFVGVPDAHAVHPKFADAAERNYFNFIHYDVLNRMRPEP